MFIHIIALCYWVLEGIRDCNGSCVNLEVPSSCDSCLGRLVSALYVERIIVIGVSYPNLGMCFWARGYFQWKSVVCEYSLVFKNNYNITYYYLDKMSIFFSISLAFKLDIISLQEQNVHHRITNKLIVRSKSQYEYYNFNLQFLFQWTH